MAEKGIVRRARLAVPRKSSGRPPGPCSLLALELFKLAVATRRKDGSLVGPCFIETDADRYQQVHNTITYWKRTTAKAGNPHVWTTRVVHSRGLCVWRIQ